MWGVRNFYFGGGSISVGVRNLSGAIAWYQEKLRLRLTPIKSEDFEALLAFGKDDEDGLALVLIPPGETKANIEAHPILFTKKIEEVHEEFASRGVTVGPIQRDSGGNRFFQFQDLEGNSIEVCHEP
jgi:catechol 2,3-dioxygenase-like lactoylglutathione lyase family enzyme